MGHRLNLCHRCPSRITVSPLFLCQADGQSCQSHAATDLCPMGRFEGLPGIAESVQVRLPAGPGTELKAIFAELAIPEMQGCGCDGRAAQMDQWGANECQARRGEILAGLVAMAVGRGLEMDGMIQEGLAIAVDTAIARAKAKSTGDSAPIP